MMKFQSILKLTLFFLLLLSSFTGQAQKEANIWYFGQKIGFDFSSKVVRTLANSGNKLASGTAAAISLSDKNTGQLLFYGNATSLWNRQHQLMPHGDSLAPQGFNSLPQAVLAIPAPGKENQYYVFTLVNTLNASPITTDLSYSLVDMRLDGGLGDVLADHKNQVIGGGYAYQFTAVPHTNGQDYWVLIRQRDAPIFDTYLLNSSGITLTHTQRIGPTQLAQPSGGNGYGFLKASPDGKKLAYLVSDYPQLSLFDFDAGTGLMSHYLNLGNLLSPGGVSFSPDNSKLYVQNYSQMLSPNYVGGRAYNVISQYDVTAGSDAAVIASGRSIIVDNPITNIRADDQGSSGDYTMQLGLDGRLYANSDYLDPTLTKVPGQSNFYVINFPNRPGFACDVQYKTFVFGVSNSSTGLPNFLQSYFNNIESNSPSAENCEALAISLFPNPTSGTFQLQVPAGCFAPYQAILYDALGRRVYQHAVTSALSETLEINRLFPGLYFLEATFPDKILRAKLTKL